MRRSAPFLFWLGVLASACADGAVVATSPPPATTAQSSQSHTAPSTPPPASPPGSRAAVAAWTGPVRPPSAAVATMGPDGSGGFRSTLDERDAAREYVDIEQVSVDFPSQPHWRLSLAAAPPKATTLDATRTVISYGLTFETTGDDAADYVVGISNEASTAGDFRVWVTDLATGATEEQVGPPYGFPVEFAHPDERGPEDQATPVMVFTFLGGTRPAGVTMSTRFYAWASVEEDGTAVAWDYAPDAGWLGAPPEAAATADVDPAPAPVGNAAGLGGFPECQADEFDFAGEGTLRELGLHTATPVLPPDIDRVGMIWVTRDLLPHDFGPPGGPVEMTRMLCFSFPDGSGGSGWPVDPTWQPPTNGAVASGEADAGGPPQAVLAVALLALLALGVSALAFRSRR
jgi:hypothetical protein